jgi:hypothetical protein
VEMRGREGGVAGGGKRYADHEVKGRENRDAGMESSGQRELRVGIGLYGVKMVEYKNRGHCDVRGDSTLHLVKVSGSECRGVGVSGSGRRGVEVSDRGHRDASEGSGDRGDVNTDDIGQDGVRMRDDGKEIVRVHECGLCAGSGRYACSRCLVKSYGCHFVKSSDRFVRNCDCHVVKSSDWCIGYGIDWMESTDRPEVCVRMCVVVGGEERSEGICPTGFRGEGCYCALVCWCVFLYFFYCD